MNSIVRSVSSWNNEETSEANIIFQDHGFYYQLLFKHGMSRTACCQKGNELT